MFVELPANEHTPNFLRPCADCVQTCIAEEPPRGVVCCRVVLAIGTRREGERLTVDVTIPSKALHGLESNLDSLFGRVKDCTSAVLQTSGREHSRSEHIQVHLTLREMCPSSQALATAYTYARLASSFVYMSAILPAFITIVV